MGLYLCWKWVLCLVVFGCVGMWWYVFSMCQYVVVCGGMFCLRFFVGCVSCGVDALCGGDG